MPRLKDKDIRLALINTLQNTYANDKQTLILQEFGLNEHKVRIDLAIINGSMSGFEIKSDADTLDRLPYQQEIYSKIFDNVTIVVGETQLKKIKTMIPRWWGIWVANKDINGIVFDIYRESGNNINVDLTTLVRCLWKQEVLEILKNKGVYERKLEKNKRSVLWNILVELLPKNELKEIIRDYLKHRDDWHIVLTQKSSDD